MAVVIDNSEDKITDEKIRILYKDEFKDEPQTSTTEEYDELYEYEQEREEINKQNLIKVYTNKYKSLTKKEKNELRESFFTNVLNNVYNYINNYGVNIHYFTKFYKEPNEEKIKEKLREELHYNLEEFLKEFNNLDIEQEEEKIKLRKELSEWKVLNELRPHPEFQNIPNVYNFIAKMCAEDDKDKKLLIETYLEKLPSTSPVSQAFQTALLAPSKTRACFFTEALATLEIFTSEYMASLISDTEIDVNKFNEEKQHFL